jgi:prepilin-type N-terminal cleavage/methylation domain-containing protein
MTKKGFTLIELLVVIVIIGILVAIALPNFIKIKDKAKEAEVKQNLHSVQLALERYSVDAPGSSYPIWIMGGDWTDSYTVWQAWLDAQGDDLSPNDIPKYQTANGQAHPWVPATTDMGDTLIMEAYMPQYPTNPFIKNKSGSLLPLINHYESLCDEVEAVRVVGGFDSNKMYEVFGPARFDQDQCIRGDSWVHHIFNNPPYDVHDPKKETTSAGEVQWHNPSGNKVLTGNFSYYARQADDGIGWPWITNRQSCVGYTLAGYGAMRTGGQDVYNRNGNYKGRFRTESCSKDCVAGNLSDVPCLCESTAPPNITANDGGSDTIIDGVVVTLDSGVDKKSSRVDIGNTEGN